MQQIILKINTQNLSEQSSGNLKDSTTLPKLIFNNPRTLPKLPAQANICRLLRLLDFDLVSQHIRFQMTNITSWLNAGFNTMKCLSTFKTHGFCPRASTLRFQVTKITSRLTPGFSTMKFRLT